MKYQPLTREQELIEHLRSIIKIAHLYGETRIPTPIAAAILAAEAKLKEYE